MTTRTMSLDSWQLEKSKYLELNIEDRRRINACKNYQTCAEIPTWKQYNSPNKPNNLSSANQIDYPIKTELNADLAEKVSLFTGDITTLEIDAIVNAANKTLLGGGGVDGAIHRRAGPYLKQECQTLNGCHVGDAKITGGYKLPAKYVIHTVGPHGEYPDLLRKCYENCLQLLRSESLSTIAFPCISTGVYGYPQEAAANVSLSTVRQYLEKDSESIDRVIFCVFLSKDTEIYKRLMHMYFPTTN